MLRKGTPEYDAWIASPKGIAWKQRISNSQTGNRNHRWKGGERKTKCEICGTIFKYKLYSSKGRFCKPECYHIWRAKHQHGSNNPRWNGGPLKCICIICGKIFDVRKGDIIRRKGRGRFCSQECHGIWQSENLSGPNSVNWQGGKSYDPYCFLFKEPFKQSIRDSYNNECILCGMTSKENGQSLDVHHIHYDKEAGCNGTKLECVPMCLSHHRKTISNHTRVWWIAYFEQRLWNIYGWRLDTVPD